MAYSPRGGRYRNEDRFQAAIKSALPPREVTENAACGMDTAYLFEPDATPDLQDAALRICLRACPVTDLCLAWSIDNPETQHGVSGGVRWPGRGHKKRTA